MCRPERTWCGAEVSGVPLRAGQEVVRGPLHANGRMAALRGVQAFILGYGVVVQRRARSTCLFEFLREETHGVQEEMDTGAARAVSQHR